jgi:hypothetical protein
MLSTSTGAILQVLSTPSRNSKRVQLYDLEGSYLRTIGEAFPNSPSGSEQGATLVIAEFYQRS